jgi:WD40 repeat protein
MNRAHDREPVPQPGKPKIPDYELLRFIGSGAYGDVWLARSITGTLCALKVVYRDRFEDQRPFEREVEGIRRFHPISRQDEGLIDLLHVGQNTSEGYFYYITELAEDLNGESVISPESYCPRTLDRVLKQKRRLPFQSALELGISLSKALACLHRHGLVHRDVKTNNVVYVNGRAKLTDMGMVSRVVDCQSFVGTEGFIAPEGAGSPQGDVYGLGKVLYEACMGKDRKEFPDLPDDIASWPEAEQLRELNEVLLKACDGDARKRHQSGDDLYADLACLLNGKSIRKIRALEKRISWFKRAALWIGFAGILAAVFGFELNRELTRKAEDRARTIATEVAQGLNLVQSGDLIEALPSLIEVTRMEGTARERLNRTRLASLLDQAPKLTHLWWHTNEATDGQFNKDGTLVVVSTRSHKVRVRDSLTGKELGVPFGRTYHLETACFNPSDETRVLVANQDWTVSMWNWKTGERYFCITNKGVQPVAARFNHKGDLFVVSCDDGVARVYSTESHQLLRAFHGHTENVQYATFSHNDQYLVTCGRDKMAIVWRVADGEKAAPPFLHGSWVTCAAFGPNDDVLVTGSADKFASVWDWRTGHRLVPRLEHRDGITSVDISPDGALILTTSWDWTARLWRTSSGKPFGGSSVLPHSGKLTRGGFAPDGRRFITVCFDGTSRIWDLAGMRPIPTVLNGLISESGNRLLVATNDTLQVLNLLTEKLISSITVPGRLLDSDICANGNFVLCVSSNDQARSRLSVFNANSGEMVSTLSNFSNSLAITRLSDDGRVLATWWKKSASILSLGTGTPLNSTIICNGTITNVVFSHDNRLFAIAAGAEVRVFEIGQTKPQFTLPHPTLLASVCFSHDDHFILTACADDDFFAYSAQVWDSRSGNPVGSRINHKDGVLFACFNPTTTQVLSCSEDFDAFLSPLKSSGSFKRLEHPHQVHLGCFSPQGSCALTIDAKASARLWDSANGNPITLPLPHTSRPNRVGFLDEVTFAATDRFRQTSVWRFGWQKQSLAEISLISQILNGQVVRPATGTNSPAETTRLWASLQARFPEDLQVSPAEIASWHAEQASAAEQDNNPAGAAFHRKMAGCATK